MIIPPDTKWSVEQALARRSPFPYFGGKRTVAATIWQALGDVRQYIEPFCGSAATLLAAPQRASQEVIGDASRYVANFWRCVRFQPVAVADWADYPVSHVDLAARHSWLTDPARTAELDASLADPMWPGDAQIAGWWVWGQCAWIGSGWCDRHVSNAGRGVQSQIPHVSDAGQGVQSKMSRGEFISMWTRALARRLEDVRIIHGSWDRCLNMHYGDKGAKTGILFDPPYVGYERLYGAIEPVAISVAKWAATRPDVRIVLCGHVGDYDAILPGWRMVRWSRGRLTYSGGATTDIEAMYLSPACLDVPFDLGAQEPHRAVSSQMSMFG